MPQTIIQTSTVTQKGQITIPVLIRRKWDLEPQDEVVFLEKEKTVEIRPAVDFFSLRGSIKAKKRYSDRMADKTLKKYFAKKFAYGTNNN